MGNTTNGVLACIKLTRYPTSKSCVIHFTNGDKVLISKGLAVASIKADGTVFCGSFSSTVIRRHIKAFANQYNVPFYAFHEAYNEYTINKESR